MLFRSPHVTHNDESDITEIDAYRKELDTVAKEKGYRVTRPWCKNSHGRLSLRQAVGYRGRPLNSRPLMPYKANEPRRHKIPKARYKIENWAEYDAALRRRGSLTVWVTPEAIAAWLPAATGRWGRPRRYSDIAIEAGLMLRLAFGRPWRQTEGMLGSIVDLLGLDLPVPDHTTFSRRSADLGVATALKKASGPVHVMIDSTGLKVFGSGEWLHEKHGGKPRRSWRKLHLAVDPDTGEILASELTTTDDGDASLVGPLPSRSTAQSPRCLLMRAPGTVGVRRETGKE